MHGLQILGSESSRKRLDQINRVRATGVGDHVSLPQLVVAGGQSAGKSSVLEGITGIPFPRQEGVCTKFPTEIILRHDLVQNRISATIVPHASRSVAQHEQFRSYRRELKDLNEVPDVISDAGTLMQLRGFARLDEGPSFGKDVLRIEIVGLTGVDLTIVDLPGLFTVPNEEQTEADVSLVDHMVDTYLDSPRTIILAVVQANNDIANQSIIKRARVFDTLGQRTVGIITKADMINEQTEGRIALLANNQDTTKLKLGFFLLKNPSPKELKDGMDSAQRKVKELKFFSSCRWKEHSLSMDRIGVDNLRNFWQALLDRHIDKELPSLRLEIGRLLQDTEQELSSMGEERSTMDQERIFLIRLSMSFSSIVRAALDGNYHGIDLAFFNSQGAQQQSDRLRAYVHLENGKFRDNMHRLGQKRQIATPTDDPDEGASETDSVDTRRMIVSEKDFDAWVKEVYHQTRGRELPGNYNHVLLSQLFLEQSGPWSQIAREHVSFLHQAIVSFVDNALHHIVSEDHIKTNLKSITVGTLESMKQQSTVELSKLIADEECHPSTYNHYYTDNIQNARNDSMRNLIRDALDTVVQQDWCGKIHVSNTSVDTEKLLAALQRRVKVNMDEQACSEAKVGLIAYYKVALKTFIDNVC